MPRQKFVQPRQHDAGGHAHRHIDAQPSRKTVGALAEHGAHLLEFVEQGAAARVIGFAFLGHLHAARGPLQQAHTEFLLELAHGGRNGRIRQAELARGAAEAVQLCDFQEDLDVVEFVHDAWIMR
jgi:hypothetical protein